MKRFSIILMTMAVSQQAFSAAPIDVAPAHKPSLSSPSVVAPKKMGINGIYKFSKAGEVIPDAFIYDGVAEGNISGDSFAVSKNEPVALEYLEDGNILMTLRLADEEKGKISEQVIITADELAQLDLKLENMGDVDDLMANYTGYEETTVAGRTQLRARRHTVRQETSRRKGSFRRDANGRIAGGGGNCVSVVKSLTGFSGTAGNGVGMASALQRRGWKVVSSGAKRAGTVCSWSGGRHGMGHVGYFDGTCFQPTYGGNCGNPGKSYRLIKCVSRG